MGMCHTRPRRMRRLLGNQVMAMAPRIPVAAQCNKASSRVQGIHPCRAAPPSRPLRTSSHTRTTAPPRTTRRNTLSRHLNPLIPTLRPRTPLPTAAPMLVRVPTIPQTMLLRPCNLHPPVNIPTATFPTRRPPMHLRRRSLRDTHNLVRNTSMHTRLHRPRSTRIQPRAHTPNHSRYHLRHQNILT